MTTRWVWQLLDPAMLWEILPPHSMANLSALAAGKPGPAILVHFIGVIRTDPS